jgi:hypothetical protein
MNVASKNPNWVKLLNYRPSGEIRFHTQYDCVVMFHLLAGLSLTETLNKHEIDVKINSIEYPINKLLFLLEKYKESKDKKLIIKILEECVNSVYAILSVSAELHLPFDSAFMLIHEANMQKIKDAVIKNKDGIIVAPEDWKPADLTLLFPALQEESK